MWHLYKQMNFYTKSVEIALQSDGESNYRFLSAIYIHK